MLGLDVGKGTGWNITYKIKGTYEDADGKFSEAYGNVVLVDCNYVLNQIIDNLYEELDFLEPKLGPAIYKELK